MSQAPPLERFLGLKDAGGGPGSLLGVEPSGLTPDALRTALAQRLALVDGHPQARSADADEVRLALHVAAAQLAESLTEPGVDRPADTQRPMRPITPDARDEQRRRTLLALIAHSGGWNATARHRVAGVAHASGLSVDEAIRLLTGGVGVAGVTVAAPAPPVEFDRPARLGSTPVGRLLLGASAVCAICSVLMLVALVWVVLSRVDDSAEPAPTVANTPGASVVGAPQAVPSGPVPVATDLDTLRSAFRGAGPEVRSFVDAYTAARDAWVELEPGAFGELAFAGAQALADGGASEAMLAPLLEDAASETEMTRSLFAVALLGRARGLLDGDERFARAVAGVVPTGVAGSMPSVYGAERLLSLGRSVGVDASAWTDAARAFLVQHREEGESSLLRMIDAMLHQPAPLGAEASRVFEQGVLLREWGEADAEVVLGWWGDTAGVTTERLSLLAGALGRSGDLDLEGLALSPSAPSSVRSASRDIVARAFGAGGSASAADPFLTAWGAAFDALDATDDLADESGQLVRAAEWSVLSHSAALWNAGDRVGAMAFFEEDEGAPASGARFTLRGKDDDDRAVSIERFTRPTASPDGVWAARYLSARRSEDDRIGLLSELAGSERALGPADADVLARAAMVGANRSVRSAAQVEVRRRADSAYLVHGMVESMHAAAGQADVSEVISYVSGRALPTVGSGAWRTASRRALLERLAELALVDERGLIGEAERVVTASYEARARAASGDWEEEPAEPEGETSVLVRSLASIGAERAGVRTLAEASDELWGALRSRASLIPEGGWATRSLLRIERRQAARSGYAAGALQGFALDQLGVVELLAYLVSAEQPGVADAIEARVSAHEEAWRAASGVAEQVRRSEREMAWLWGVRLGVIGGGW